MHTSRHIHCSPERRVFKDSLATKPKSHRIVRILIAAALVWGLFSAFHHAPYAKATIQPKATFTTKAPKIPKALAAYTKPTWTGSTVKITGCSPTAVSGTLVNTTGETDTYMVSVSESGGELENGIGNTEVVNVPPHKSVSWQSSVTFSNAPTGPVSCTLNDVLRN